jgi:hypothetical protein
MIDVIAPGPASRGMSGGKIATSMLSSAASVSAPVVDLCRCGGQRPCRLKAGATSRRRQYGKSAIQWRECANHTINERHRDKRDRYDRNRSRYNATADRFRLATGPGTQDPN